MMTTAKIFTAFIIVVATMWGTAQQANAINGSTPGGGSLGSFQRAPTGEYGHGYRTTTHYSKHKHHH